MDQQDVIDYEEWLDEQLDLDLEGEETDRDCERKFLKEGCRQDGSALPPPA